MILDTRMNLLDFQGKGSLSKVALPQHTFKILQLLG
jgi:hypothetical protein